MVVVVGPLGGKSLPTFVCEKSVASAVVVKSEGATSVVLSVASPL